MIPQAHITAWRNVAPWPDDAQVEQDLVLSRATVAMFADGALAEQIALRGGTALNKLFITPGVRYSEDIDLPSLSRICMANRRTPPSWMTSRLC